MWRLVMSDRDLAWRRRCQLFGRSRTHGPPAVPGAGGRRRRPGAPVGGRRTRRLPCARTCRRPPRRRPRPTKSASEYTARHLQVLEGLEAVRKRPGMYIGSTDSRGLMHCLWEIIDNAVDEALGGHCDHIEVILHPDGSVEVRDNGRGIPVDIEPRTGLSGVEVVFTKLHAGGKFGGGSYTAIRRPARRRRLGGQRAVLAPRRRGRPRRQDLRDELPARRAGRLRRRRRRQGRQGPRAPVHPLRRDQRAARSSARPAAGSPAPGCATGPTSRSSCATPPSTYDGLVARARQTSFLVPGLTLVIRDERAGTRRGRPTEEIFLHDGGITEFCEFLAPDPAVTDVWRLQGTGTSRRPSRCSTPRGT